MSERQIVDACVAMGFALAGVTRARRTDREQEIRRWLDAGRHGEMGFMAELLDERLDVTRMLPGARSVIMVADRYASSGEEDGKSGTGAGAVSRVARYARGRDYHAVIKRRLKRLSDRLREMHPHAEFRSFVDTGPVMEREHAERAFARTGAFIGKHTLLIDPRSGSWLLLGGVATTLEIQVEGAHRRVDRSGVAGPVKVDACGGCTRCIDACPTGAITAFEVDARRCVSYLTIEHQSLIQPELFGGIGEWLIGCDVCQEVCPFNGDRGAVHAVNPAYMEVDGRGRLESVEVMRWSAEDRRRVLAGSAGKRANLEMVRRNAVINAGNFVRRTGEVVVRDEIQRIAEDRHESELVRATAAQVLKWLGGGP